MSKVQIGTSEHNFCDVGESWVQQHVEGRRKDGHPVCAIVTLNNDSVNVVLSTPQCAHSQTAYRRPNEKEAELVKLWKNEHLNEPDWTAGNLAHFVKKAQRLFC